MGLHIAAVQPHHLGQIARVKQRLGVVQRGLHVLFGIGNRLGPDVPGAGANRLAALLDGIRGRRRAGDQLPEHLAGLLEARFRHRLHVLWNLEMLTPLVAHGPSPVLLHKWPGVPS